LLFEPRFLSAGFDGLTPFAGIVSDAAKIELREPTPYHSNALGRLDAPFEHSDWIFEPKLDGFRAVHGEFINYAAIGV
jgi:hypothetical protein